MELFIFAFFEFFPLINSKIELINEQGDLIPRSSFTEEMYTELIEEKVQTLADTGAKIIVVSSVEEFGYTFYDSPKVRAGIVFDNEEIPEDNDGNPDNDDYEPRKFNENPESIITGFYLDGVKILLDKADALNLDVVLGVGRNGDKELMIDLHRHYKRGINVPNIENRFQRNFVLTKERVRDLDAKYHNHPAMKGFYLTHETSRFTATKGRYYKPAARFINDLDNNDQPKPPATSNGLNRNDYVVYTSPSYIYKDERTAHQNSLNELASAGIDVLLYQDRMGVGVVEDGNGVKFTYDSDYAINNYLYDYLSTIYGLHVNAQAVGGQPPEMWINMESWRIECAEPLNNAGKCPEGEESQYHPAHYTSLQKQIDIAQLFGVKLGTYEISALFQRNGAKYRFKNNQRCPDPNQDPQVCNYRVRAIYLLDNVVYP